jgi:hypothetical protein
MSQDPMSAKHYLIITATMIAIAREAPKTLACFESISNAFRNIYTNPNPSIPIASQI